MVRIVKLLHLPLSEDSASLGLEQSSTVGSFVHVPSSPLRELSRTGLHHALQDMSSADGDQSHDIEMDQLHTETLDIPKEKTTERTSAKEVVVTNKTPVT